MITRDDAKTAFSSSISLESNEKGSQSSDEDNSKKSSSSNLLPTFTNEVIVIRPEYFYENADCQQDNNFKKSSPLLGDSTNE